MAQDRLSREDRKNNPYSNLIRLKESKVAESVCIGKRSCGAIKEVVKSGFLTCPKCGGGAVWLGKDAAQRVKEEGPGLAESLRMKYAPSNGHQN